MKSLRNLVNSAMATIAWAAVAAEPPDPLSLAFPRNDPEFVREGAGRIARFTLTARGRLDGFLLEDGLDVRLPLDLSERLAAVVRPGDMVLVKGWRSPASPVIIASSVTDAAGHETVAVAGQGPKAAEAPAPLAGPPVAGAEPTIVSGKVLRPIFRPQGGVEGAVLEDGPILRLAPQTSNRAEILLTPGRRVSVQGWGLRTPFGLVVAAEQVTETAAAEALAEKPGAAAAPRKGRKAQKKRLGRRPSGGCAVWICRWTATGPRSSAVE